MSLVIILMDREVSKILKNKSNLRINMNITAFITQLQSSSFLLKIKIQSLILLVELSIFLHKQN